MKTLTLAIEDKALERARALAARRHMSVEQLVEEMLAQQEPGRSPQWLEECFALMDRANGDSRGATWKRSDRYSD